MSICFLCGGDGADTTEHVVPRCLYPDALPSDVITLPAHEQCNKFTAKDEEAFRNHIAVAIPPESPGHALWQKTWKAIHRPQGAGMQRTFYTEMLSVPEVGQDGVVRALPVATRLKYERANRVLAKIVKGIFAHATGDVFPGEAILWRFGQAENGRDQVRLPHAFKVHDVLDVSWGRASDAPFATMWVLGFYGVVWFWVSTMPKTVVTPEGQETGELMLWPGPGSTKGGLPAGGAREAPVRGSG